MKKSLLIVSLIFLLVIGIVFSENNDGKSKVGNEIEEALKVENSVPVIVVLEDILETDKDALKEYSALNSEDSFQIKKEMIAEQQDKVLENLELKGESKAHISTQDSYDFDLETTFSIVNGFSGEVTKQGLEKLKSDPDVIGVYPNRPVSAFLSESKEIVNASSAWRLMYNSANLTGKGEVICIIDTGVDYTHPGMGNCASTNNINDGSCSKVIGGYDFINNDEDPIDDHGHGTYVAGIVASANETYTGIAPDSKIIAVKVLDSNGTGSDDTLISGIEWCTNNASLFNISAISMSLGVAGYKNATYCDSSDNPLLVNAIHNAIGRNIAVIAASGNDGNSPLGVSTPACISNVTAVGSTTKTDSISSFSNLWDLPMLLAPGSGIASLKKIDGVQTLDGT